MEKIVVGQENTGKRVDKFLAEEFFLYSRVVITKKINNGDILVNGNKIKPSYKLEINDEITVILPFESLELEPNSQILLDIVYEDQNFVVINKPAGLQVHPSSGNKKETLVNALLHQYPEIKDVHDGSFEAELRPGIVHRLDRDTSGLILVAKNKETLLEFKKLFQQRLVQKKYVAICWGIFEEKMGEINKPLAKSADYSKQIVADRRTKTSIKEAITKFEVIKEFEDFSLVAAWPKTGRTHQIRVHLAYIGHPIVGDRIYFEKNMKEKNEKLAKRQLLHAGSLEFEFLGQKYAFNADLPADFREFWERIDGLKVI